MRNVFLTILISSVFSIGFAQTAIPLPTGFPTASTLSCSQIGDFDGDGSVDLYVTCTVYGGTSVIVMGVYSVKKADYLFVESKPNVAGSQYSNMIFGDFNGDSKNEIIVSNILYAYSTTTSKKKV